MRAVIEFYVGNWSAVALAQAKGTAVRPPRYSRTERKTITKTAGGVFVAVLILLSALVMGQGDAHASELLFAKDDILHLGGSCPEGTTDLGWPMDEPGRLAVCRPDGFVPIATPAGSQEMCALASESGVFGVWGEGDPVSVCYHGSFGPLPETGCPPSTIESTMFDPFNGDSAHRCVEPVLFKVAPAGAQVCRGQLVTVDMNSNGGSGVGTPGDDVILGTPGADFIQAGAGDDLVCAGDGNDVVIGGDGDDEMFGEGGSDVMRGNAGSDRIDGGEGDDRVLGGTGDDDLRGGDGHDHLGGFGGADWIWGGTGNDRIFGGFGPDVIHGETGKDAIFGLVGNDRIFGGDGSDVLNGGRGNDTIEGGTGNDIIQGGSGNDDLWGDAGNDVVRGGRGDDSLSGGETGNDLCVGNQQNAADTADTTCETVRGVP